jgi:NADPH-dependent ferric siderophore reductase
MSFCEPARVVTVTSLTPHMRRISIEAEGDWHWPTGGQGDERIDIAFPKPGETEADSSCTLAVLQRIGPCGPNQVTY